MGQKGGLGSKNSIKPLEIEPPHMELNAILSDHRAWFEPVFMELNDILSDHRAWFEPVFIEYNTGNNTKNAGRMYGGAPDCIGTLVNKAHIVDAFPQTTVNPNIVRDLKDFVPKARKRMQNVRPTMSNIETQLMPPSGGCSLNAYTIFVCSVFRELAPMLPMTAVNASTVTIKENIKVSFGRFEDNVMAFITIKGRSYEIYSPIPLVNALLTSDERIMQGNVQISLDQIPLITEAMKKMDMTTLDIIMQELKDDHTIHVVNDVTIITSDSTVSKKTTDVATTISSSASSSSPVIQEVPTIIELATYK